jgi:hypothetical protein
MLGREPAGSRGGRIRPIAPYASFTRSPQLAELAKTKAPAVSLARARATDMSYEEATAAVTDIVERRIADHTDASGS